MAKTLKDPGVGFKSQQNAKRVIVDGESNVLHINRPKTVDDLYTYLININWGKFLFFVLFGYIVLNSIFALIYFFIGVSQFLPSTNNTLHDFSNLFFFSAQTLTTVGYGAISPSGMLAGLISSFEALLGLVSFSLITGLLYGRFSKPESKIRFSKHLLLRDFHGHKALMFRVMNKRTNIMIEPELNAVINIQEKDEEGNFTRNFYQLKFQLDKIMFMTTMWTVVHVIDEDSPLSKYTAEELEKMNAEIYILFQYHENAYNQKLYQIHSYDFSELKINHQFGPSYSFNEEGFMTLDHDTLHDIEVI